ncbi:MAG: hypothetical protein CK427_16370 [Leptospira sp.]|nr:MAG: hypothetical protein CK427_16370 [Leptospira sp.]
MKIILTLFSIFFFAFLIFNIYLDTSLVTTRNNFLLFLLISISVSYFFQKPQKRNILDFTFFLLGGIIIIYLSYSAIVNFPTNDIINRNFLRTLNYILLGGYIFFYLKYSERSYLIPATYLILIHSIFFMYNDYLAIYLFPYLLISIALEKFLHNNSKINISSWMITLYLFLILTTIFITKPASIQEFRAYGLLITLIPIILVIRNIPEINISNFLYLIVIIFIIQGLVLNFNIIRDLLFVHHTIQPRGTIIGIPVSSIGSLGSLGFFISTSYILYSKSNRVQSILGFLLFAISLMLLYFSYSRTSIIASILVFFLIYIFTSKKNIHLIYKNKLNLTLFIILLVISSFIFIQKSFELNTFHVRLSIWEFHLKSVLQFSPYFGLGMEPEWRMIYSLPKNLSQTSFNDLVEYLNTFRSNPIAHNLIVQTFSSFGFIGIVSLLSFIIYLILPVFKFLFKKEISHYNLLYTATLIGILIHELTDVSIIEHQVFFPVVGIITLLKPKTDRKDNGILNIMNISILSAFIILILISIIQINMMKIHKKDLKDIYSADNLMYLIEKDSNIEQVSWSQPKTDIAFDILHEKNFYKLKYFYHLHKFKSSNDLSYISQAAIDLKKCILLKPEEPLCIFYLAETIQYLEPNEFSNITEFLYTIAKIQDPFFTINKGK